MRYPLGQYKRPMQIEAQPADRGERTQRDGYGAPVSDWLPVASRDVRLEPVGGGETVHADQVNGTVTHKLNFRYFAGLTSRHRLRMGQRAFNLMSVIDLDDEHYEHECQAIEVVLKPVQPEQ